jgi:hypothetical protein
MQDRYNKAATAPDKDKELPSLEVELTDEVLKNIAGGAGGDAGSTSHGKGSSHVHHSGPGPRT